jgi:hypothetical protein
MAVRRAWTSCWYLAVLSRPADLLISQKATPGWARRVRAQRRKLAPDLLHGRAATFARMRFLGTR